MTKVWAVGIHRGALRSQISARHELVGHMLPSLARQVRWANSILANLVFADVPGRVAKALLQLAVQFGHVEGRALRVTHDLTQREMAQHISATRETVCMLRQLAHRCV